MTENQDEVIARWIIKRKKVNRLKVNFQKLQIALATSCMNPYNLCKETGIQYQTYKRIAAGNKCKPATVGKIAKALNVPVTEIIEID